MATQFLLPCTCGEKHLVAKTQAGQELTCKCGAKLEVPTIRELANLEQVVQPDEPTPWSRSQGILFVAGAFVLIAGAAATFWLIRQTPSFNLDDPQLLTDWNLRSHSLPLLYGQDPNTIARVAARWDRDYERLTAGQSLAMWSLYRDLQPFMLQLTLNQREIKSRSFRYRLWTWVVAGLTVVIGTSMIGTALVRRQ